MHVKKTSSGGRGGGGGDKERGLHLKEGVKEVLTTEAKLRGMNEVGV